MQNVFVRLMKPEDLEQVYRIDVLTQKEYLGSAWELMEKDEQNTHLVSKSLTFSAIVSLGLSQVATEKNGTIMGFILAYSDNSIEDTVIVKYIAVDTAYRRCGVGDALYGGLIQTAKKLAKKQILAYINTDNPKSISLHRKIGFLIKPRIEAVLTI